MFDKWALIFGIVWSQSFFENVLGEKKNCQADYLSRNRQN